MAFHFSGSGRWSSDWRAPSGIQIEQSASDQVPHQVPLHRAHAHRAQGLDRERPEGPVEGQPLVRQGTEHLQGMYTEHEEDS